MFSIAHAMANLISFDNLSYHTQPEFLLVLYKTKSKIMFKNSKAGMPFCKPKSHKSGLLSRSIESPDGFKIMLLKDPPSVS